MLQRRLKHGWNEFSVDNTEPIWKKYLDQVRVFSTDSHFPWLRCPKCLYIEIFRVSTFLDSALGQDVPRILKLSVPTGKPLSDADVGSFKVEITS